MASDGNPVKILVASPVHVSQPPIPVSIQERSGKPLPASGKSTAVPAAPTTLHAPAKVSSAPSVEALVAQLNKHLNDSGRPDQFRVDPSSGNTVIQQINPANGTVVGEFLISESRSVGISGGALIDSRA